MSGRVHPEVPVEPQQEMASVSAEPGETTGEGVNRPTIGEYENPAPLPFDPLLGETEAEMKLAEMLNEQGGDMSIDAPWQVNSFGAVDVYTLLVMLLFFVPKLIVLFPLLWFMLFPAVFVNWLYISRASQPLVSLKRTGCTWYMHLAFQWGLSLPASVLILVNYVIDNIIWLIFGVLYCTLTCGWSRWAQNRAVIRPFNNGPNLYLHFSDIVVAVGGMIFRQGLAEFMVAFPMMFIVNPWVKYWMIGNPFLLDFTGKLRFITQIGQTMNDMPLESIDENFRKCISNCKHVEKNRQEIDSKFFCPHYPYPPEGRQWAIGMQLAKLVTTFVHTTHLNNPRKLRNGFCLSSSAQVPEYRVILWHNNPFHIFTGYVEANISHGRPSQAHKQYGAEHPMWLVNGHSYLGSNRTVRFSIGWIDVFFDKFIPHFQHFIRGSVRGWKIADEELLKDPAKGYEDTVLPGSAGGAGGGAGGGGGAGRGEPEVVQVRVEPEQSEPVAGAS